MKNDIINAMIKTKKDRIDKKGALFDVLNGKLCRLDSSLGANIRCPLCWKQFSQNSLQSDLSLEHVPPEAVAKLIREKSLTTLTCRDCNNTSGTRYQKDLKLFLRHQLLEFGKYTGPIPGTVALPGASPLHCNITWTPETIRIIGVPRANNPATTQKHMKALDEIVNNKVTDWEFKLTGNYGYRLPVAWLAYLQIAYLLAFILTDCCYAFTRAGTELRSLLFQGTAGRVGPCLIPPQVVGIGGKPWLATVTGPSDLKCYWAKVAGNIVILPLPDDSNLSCYKAWQKICDHTHFGLVPKNLRISLTFSSGDDAVEAQKCLPGFFANASDLKR
jgi:hypothetical protein